MRKKIFSILLFMFCCIGIVRAADMQEVYVDGTILVNDCTIYNSTDDHLSLINIGDNKCLVTPVKVGSAQLNLSPATSTTQKVNFYDVKAGVVYDTNGDYVAIGKFVNTINTGKVSNLFLADYKETLEDKTLESVVKAAYYEKVLYIAVGTKNSDEELIKISFDEDKHILSDSYESSDKTTVLVASILSEWLSESARNYSEIEKLDKNQNKEIFDAAKKAVLDEIFKITTSGSTISSELLLDNKINDKILAKYTELLEASKKSEDPTIKPDDTSTPTDGNKGPGVENPNTGFGSYLFVIVLGIVAIVLVLVKGRKIYKI